MQDSKIVAMILAQDLSQDGKELAAKTLGVLTLARILTKTLGQEFFAGMLPEWYEQSVGEHVEHLCLDINQHCISSFIAADERISFGTELYFDCHSNSSLPTSSGVAYQSCIV